MMTIDCRAVAIFSARVYDATEVFKLKKDYNKDSKRKPQGKNKRWEYMDEVELQKSKRLVGASVDRLRAGIEPPQEPVKMSGRGLKA